MKGPASNTFLQTHEAACFMPEFVHDSMLRYSKLIPCHHRIAKAAHQVRMVAKFSKDPNGPESSHSAAQYALHLGGLKELAVQTTLVRR